MTVRVKAMIYTKNLVRAVILGEGKRCFDGSYWETFSKSFPNTAADAWTLVTSAKRCLASVPPAARCLLPECMRKTDASKKCT